MILKSIRVCLVTGGAFAVLLGAPTPGSACDWLTNLFSGCGCCCKPAVPAATYYAAPAPCNPCQQQVVSYVPQTCYRTQVVDVPVTTFRPISTCDPCTGCPVTTMQPVTTTQRQAQMIPYTTYRPVVNNPCAQPVVTTGYAAPAAGCATCASPAAGCGTCAAPAAPATTYYQPAVPAATYYQPAAPAATYYRPVAPAPAPAPATTYYQPAPAPAPATTYYQPAPAPAPATTYYQQSAPAAAPPATTYYAPATPSAPAAPSYTPAAPAPAPSSGLSSGSTTPPPTFQQNGTNPSPETRQRPIPDNNFGPTNGNGVDTSKPTSSTSAPLGRTASNITRGWYNPASPPVGSEQPAAVSDGWRPSQR